jgi:cytochrome c oxidase subunit 1
MHGLAVMGGAEARLRNRGAAGLFGWLRRIDFKNASIAALACSLILFAIGGWTGTAQTTLQLNMVSHNTMWIPAHVHAIVVGGTLFGFGLGVPSLLHGLAVMGGAEAKLREGRRLSLFGWLRRVRWGNASIAALGCSLLLFAIGGWSGTVETTLQLNMLTHNTMWVPAHVHAIVVGGTTLAFMGFAYLLVPLLVQRQLWMPRLATVQAYLYGFGLLALIATQTWGGMLGIPRRVARVDVGGDPSSWKLPMDLMGVAGALAGLGGALFVVIMVMTLLRGKRTDDPALLTPSAVKS